VLQEISTSVATAAWYSVASLETMTAQSLVVPFAVHRRCYECAFAALQVYAADLLIVGSHFEAAKDGMKTTDDACNVFFEV
jgi:hypothetical protein